MNNTNIDQNGVSSQANAEVSNQPDTEINAQSSSSITCIPISQMLPMHGLEFSEFQLPKALLLRNKVNIHEEYWNIWKRADKNSQSLQLSEQSCSLIAQLEPLGIVQSDVFIYELEVGHRERSVDFSWPETIEWNGLPYLKEPLYKVTGGFNKIRDFKNWYCPDTLESKGYSGTPRQREALDKTIRNVEIIIYDHPNPDSWMLADLAHLLSLNEKSPLVLGFDGEILRPIDPSTILQAQEEWAATEWFMYNYAINARAILGRIWFAAVQSTREGKKREHWQSFIPFLGGLPTLGYHPLALQTIYHLSDFKGEPVFRNAKEAKHHSDIEIHQTSLLIKSGLAREIGENSYQLFWQGSGKYPEWKSTELQKKTSMSMEEAFDRKRKEIVTRQSIERFLKTYLTPLIWEGEKSYIITEIGEYFLKLLGPEFKDSDLFLRWRDGDKIVSWKNFKEAQEWMAKYFSAMKSRAEQVPAQWNLPKLQKKWNKEGTYPVGENDQQQGLVGVWGKILPFRPENLLDDSYPLELALAAIRGEGKLKAIAEHKNTYLIYSGILFDFGDENERQNIKDQASLEMLTAPKDFLEYSKTSEFGLHLVRV